MACFPGKELQKLTVCSVHQCVLAAYETDSKCILHCRKEGVPVTSHQKCFGRLFYTELIKYIAEFAFENKKETDGINKITLKKYLEHNGHDRHQEIIEFATESTIVLTKIVLPGRDSSDDFDYLIVLNKLGAIHFSYCEFRSYGLKLDVKTFFQECLFHENWHIYNLPILENNNDVLYQQCTFHEKVHSSPDVGERYEISSSLFNDCKFLKKIDFGCVDFNAPIFHNTDNIHTEIDELRLSDCTFQEKFILNNCKIGSYISEDSVFYSKFEFKDNIVQNFDANNTNHFKLVDCYGTKFTKFRIQKSIYEDFVGLEHCEFGVIENNSTEYVATFMYATFLSFVNFRNTNFHSGLDIEHINLKESPNFLNTKINPKNSNRETFRIIKNSFDKIGNHIEANIFFVFEMKKYKEELSDSNNVQEKIIACLNEKISNFGQSYIRPAFLIVMTSLVYYVLILGYENNMLYRLFPPANNIISTISNMLNSVAENILPFAKLLKNGMEFVSLIFYIVFAILISQIIIAVKRHTRR